MPRNVTTGKTNRQSLSTKEVFEYQLEQRKEPKLCSVGPQKGKKPANSQDDNPQVEVSGSRLSPTASLAKMTLDSPSSKGDSPVPEPKLGTSSALLPVAPVVTQIPAPSFQGHQLPSQTTLLQLNDDFRTIARLTKVDEGIGAFIAEALGWRKTVSAIKKELEEKYKGTSV